MKKVDREMRSCTEGLGGGGGVAEHAVGQQGIRGQLLVLVLHLHQRTKVQNDVIL